MVQLKQIRMVLQIQNDPNFHQNLLQYLKDNKHPIHALCTNQAIKRIQTFLGQQLKRQIALLQAYFCQQSYQEKVVTQTQKMDCDGRLIKIFQIMEFFYKNQDFCHQQDSNLPLFNQIMTLSDNFQLQAKLMALLMNTTFEKTQKQFFYNIYFLCDHLDIYDLHDSSIKELYQLGKTRKSFKFFFIDKNQEKSIVIDDFYTFLWNNGLANKHYRQITSYILKSSNICLEQGSMTHLALLSKVKLYFKSVHFSQAGEVCNNADPVVQAVAYANAMYCYIQYYVLGQETVQNMNIPNIFSFPPAYSDMFRQLLEVFLLSCSNKETHLMIMKSINQILEIQEKTSTVDIVGRLNDNSSLIYKYLAYVKNYLNNQESFLFSNSIKKINLEAVSMNEFMVELFKIMTIQVQQTHELNSIACSIVEKIFKKETICTYNDEVIKCAGNLLISIEFEQEKLMKIIIQRFSKQPEKGKPYLRILNEFFSKRLHRYIQRRDLAYIARESSQSMILLKVEQLIKQQIKTGNIDKDSFLVETLQLIGNICEQSPTLLQTIQKTNPNIIPYLFSICQHAINIPADLQSITDTIGFMHHVSLVQGPVRNQMMKRPLISFITRILTHDKFSQSLTKNNKSVTGVIAGTINRFIANIKVCRKYVYNAFINAAIRIDQEYEKCSIKNVAGLSYGVDQEIWDRSVCIQKDSVINMLKCDGKLINLLKLIQRSSQIILKKFNSRSLYMLLRPLLKIALQRDNVFLDCSLQHSLLKQVINETISTIKQYNQSMLQKQVAELSQKEIVKKINLCAMESEELRSEDGSQPIEQDEHQQPNQRLITENNQPQPQNQNQHLNGDEVPPAQPSGAAVPASISQDQGLRHHMVENEFSDEQDISEYEGMDQQKLSQNRPNRMQSQEQTFSKYDRQKEFFQGLTWRKTMQLTQKYESLPEQVIRQLYDCYQNLDRLILPIMKMQPSPQNPSKKQAIIKQISENSIMDQLQRQIIQSYERGQQDTPSFKFNLLNILLNSYSSKLQRLLKFLQFTLNFDHSEFNLPQYESIIQRFNQYLIFYLEVISESNAKNILFFIDNQEIKYLETSKLPKSRVQTKTLDFDNLRRNLQNQLNEKWTLYNVLFDSFLRLVSGNLNSPSTRQFLKKPEGLRHFQFIIGTLLENIQGNIVDRVIPLLTADISAKDFQLFRQAIKVVMQIFALNDLRTIDKVKSQSNLLITFYLYSFDPRKQNIFSVLSRISVEQQRYNKDQEQVYEDSKQNRWKYIKKIFLKMTFYKIKYFLSQAFQEQIDPIQVEENQPGHFEHEKQMRKNYFIFSRIHEMLCIFIENSSFCQVKNGYVKDLLLFNFSLFALFSNRIRTHKDTIYFNYLFEDNHSKQLTQDQFYCQINARNSILLKSILDNLSTAAIFYLPMILRAILEAQRPREQVLLAKFNQQMKDMFIQVSRKIDLIHYTLTGNHLGLGFQMPMKRSVVASMQISKADKCELFFPVKIQQQSREQAQLDLKRQVLCFVNLLAFVIEFTKYFKDNQCFQQGHLRITANYIKSMVQFSSFLLANFQVQKHFPQQGDSLVVAIIRLVEQFNLYKGDKIKFIKEKKLKRKKERHFKNKKKYKQIKRHGKQFDRQSHSNTSQVESISQSVPSKMEKKSTLKAQKLQKKANKSPKKTLKRQKPQYTNNKADKGTSKQKKPSPKECSQAVHQQILPKGSILNRVVTDFIKISLTASQNQPYLCCRTAKLIINFIQSSSKDVVLRSQTDINNINSGKLQKIDKGKFFIFGAQIFADLLKVKIKNQKIQGFFYLITYLAMRLMNQVHVKIDFQCAIKRFFYEQEMKAQSQPFTSTPKDRQRIKLAQFESYLINDSMIDFPDLSYFLSIVEIKKRPDDQIQKKDHPLRRKKDEDYTQQVHEFNKKNLKKYKSSPEDKMYVRLKNPQQLDVISLPSIKRRKLSHIQDQQKKVKFYEYHPDGDFAALICQVIRHIIKIMIKQIVQNFCPKSQGQQNQQLAFNFKILLYTLQVLCRQSPTIVPWIARFKCKKILLNEFKDYNLAPESQAYKKIVSYVYGKRSLAIQDFQQVSFLTLMVKFVYPISQISTFLFQLCLDNNVLIQNKSDKPKDSKQKQASDGDIKKFTPFGSIIRQKIVSELQSQLSTNKNFDQAFIRNNFDPNQSDCMMMKKVSCLGLLTILLSVRQLAKLCIQNNMLKRIQDEYLRTSAIVKHLCNPSGSSEVSLPSSVMRNFLLNYFIRPMEILQQLTVQYNIMKKHSAIKLNHWFTNSTRLHIRFLLTGDTINDQLFRDDIFFKSKFKTEWLYANNLQGDDPLQIQEGLEGSQNSSIDGDDQSLDPYAGIFDSEQENGPLLDQQIQDEDDQIQIQISGQQLLHQHEGQDEDEQGQNYWQGQLDPFDRDSNTFQNIVLYPGQDHILENQDHSDSESESDDQDLDDIDLDQDDIDQYNDSQEQQDGLQIQLQPSDGNMLFPIDQNPIEGWPFGQGQHRKHSSIQRIVPEIGIYYYFIPQQPDRRQHPNHICQFATKPQIKQLQNLYEIFMDVVSFEHIVITNNMVKLENQQAKMLRKIFKISVYKKLKGTRKLHNEPTLKMEQEYYQQIYRIFSLDSMLPVCQKIDFKQCQRMSYFLQSIPTHYVDMYMDDPQTYFNQITKPLRARRRGMFMNPHLMQRFRRGETSHSHYRNMANPLGNRLLMLNRPPPGAIRPLERESSSNNIYIQNAQENQEQAEGQEAQQQQDPMMNRIEFNLQNPNGGVINFTADLSQILENMGMTEWEFLNLPNEVQSDIIQNSLQNQLQREGGNLNQLVAPFMGGIQAPNVSPLLMPHRIQEQDQDHDSDIQVRQDDQLQNGVQMPQSFNIDQQRDIMHQSLLRQYGQHMQQEQSNTPINQINNHQNQSQIHRQSNHQMHRQNHQNHQSGIEQQALPQRYRKISLEHSHKISKDIIQILNKDNKNDAKFPQISEQLLEQILETMFILENKDFSRFPYSFLSMNMINSKSSSKILSTIITLLSLYPCDSQLNGLVEGRQRGQQQIKAKRVLGDLFPKTCLRTYLYQISKDYENEIYANISIKLLHILQNLTKSYSISMQMLKVNNSPLKKLQKYLLSGSKQQAYLSSFQTLIRLLNSETVCKSPIIVQYILRITNNIVSHYFEKNIFSIHQQQKEMKQPKQQIKLASSMSEGKIQAQAMNTLPVCLQGKQESPSLATQLNKAIQLSDWSIQLLCSLLMSDQLRQSQNLSQLIMKLSINGKNLISFIKNIETVLEKLCNKSIVFLNREKQQFDDEKKLSNSQAQQTQIQDLMKVFCLLQIFSSMIKEFKQFAYRHHVDRYDFIIDKFKNIIQSKSLFTLCQIIASIISNTGEDNSLMKSIPEIFEIFFSVFSINIQLTTKNGHQDKNTLQQKESNKIASLAQINEKYKNFTNIKKSDQSIVSPGAILIENVPFNKLWNEKVCSPNGRLLLNSTIKRKLSAILKRKKQSNNVSLFDIPMIKIIINSPHLLDFQNKRALFRAQIKRIKKKTSSQRTIHLSLDRKQVFQQSFNFIMHKKRQQLKRRIKIDFQGQEGQDVGGLTRQWYQLLSTQMFNPNYGLFKPSSTGNTYQPSSTSYVNSEHLNYFKFIGRIMGKALLDGFMLAAYFTPAFYKHILKIPITYLDMQQEDYEYFNSLKWILSNSPIQQYMDLDFTYEFDNFGELKTKELIANGESVKVTEQNKLRYVQLICYAKMATAVQAQLQKFLEGLHEIVPYKYLKLFDPKQLEMMISGLPTIDIVDLKRNTEIQGYVKTEQIIIWLFEVLESFDMTLRTAFLQFVTGTSRVPSEGFKGLNGYSGPQKFKIQKQFDIQKLPRAHTCFNTIDLPPYPTKQMLIQKLTYAITQGKEGFGMV